jgi:DNA-binding HxlR family transcriptional regulator
VDSFRYEQFCPLARAAEILGHRWVIPILRELLVGPQRFSDFRRRLPGLSSSVLADRLAGLELKGVVSRRELDPPAASTIYELTANGQALEPALLELTRWGARFIAQSRPGDHVEPDWLNLAVTAFARSEATPARRFELRPYGENGESIIRVEGGSSGTHSIDDEEPVDARIRAPVVMMMGLMSGVVSIDAALASEEFEIEGDTEAASELPDLFLMNPEP